MNTQLKDELDQLVQLQQRPQITWNSESREEMNDKKKAFDETVQRVRQQYFNQQKENVCADIESVRFFEIRIEEDFLLKLKVLEFWLKFID